MISQNYACQQAIEYQKPLLYDKTNTRFTFLYDAQAWTLLHTDAAALWVFKIKVLCKIIGPVRVGNYFRIRSNSEIYELLDDIDVVQHINIQRLRWLEHVCRIETDAPGSYLMQRCEEFGEALDFVCIERIKSRLVWPTGVDTQEAKQAEIHESAF